MVNYPVGDFLIRIKNAALARKQDIRLPATGFVKKVADALRREGFLEKVVVKDKILKARLAYDGKEPALVDMRIISKPGLRVYKKIDELEAKKGASTYIISTPKGVMSLKEALKKRQGGEVIVEIW